MPQRKIRKIAKVLIEEEEDIMRVFEQEIKKVERTLDQIDQIYRRDLRKLDRLSDQIAVIGGSWSFITGFIIVLIAWVVLNAVILATKPFDPYPFILLNLFLSMLAAIQAPVILMSQNRAARRDQARAEIDLEKDLRDLRIDQRSHEILLGMRRDITAIKKKMGM